MTDDRKSLTSNTDNKGRLQVFSALKDGRADSERRPLRTQNEKKTTWIGKKTKGLSNPVEFSKATSTNILCSGADGSSAIIVLPAAQAKRLANGSTGDSVESNETIPSIQTVASFDEYMPESTANKWSFGRMMEYVTTGCC